MNLLLSLFVAQVVWAALSHADVTPTPVASLVMKRQADVVMQDEPAETPTSTTQASSEVPKPKIYSMHVTSHIEYRFANTLISSRVANPASVSQEVFFSFTLPETAFISKFLMEVDGKVYEATVKEKKKAKQVYDDAVSAGLGAAHVAVSARDSNVFTVSVNVEPTKKINFNLTYEELLIRRLGAYNHVINLDPGQIVADLRVDVYIKEHKNITVLRVPVLRSGNEVDADETTAANPLARIERSSGEEVHISFAPTVAEQKQLGRVPGLDNKEQFGYPTAPKVVEGLGGQFVVQYDVDRSDKAGEVLVNNGYFVHFFSPAELTPLPKHAIFVLDLSGSMIGRKLEQLKHAMNAILDDLNEGDYFNVIAFSFSVKVWDLDAPVSQARLPEPRWGWNQPDEESSTDNQAPVPAFPATREYIAKAKEIVNQMLADGGTNIHDALKTAIRVAHEGLQNVTSPSAGEEKQRNPIIVFLTDGEPTVGETRPNKIFSVVQELNTGPEAALFSLAFGDDADLDFLKKLSLKNSGFARKIYEASDAALQLRDFYRQISSPLLANVTFSYQPDKIEQSATTRTHFHTLFSGSEIIVAGKIKPTAHEKVTDIDIEGTISGLSYTGDSTFEISRPYPVLQEVPHPVTSLERLWAYLTIQQLLEQQAKGEAEDEATAVLQETDPTSAANETLAIRPISPRKKALSLALQYSFVTPLTSLVVVKPNSTKETDALRTDARNEPESNILATRAGSSGYSTHYQTTSLRAGAPPTFARPSMPAPLWGSHHAPMASPQGVYYSMPLPEDVAVDALAEDDEDAVMSYRPSNTPPPNIRPRPSSTFATSTPATTSQSTTVLIGLEELEWLEDASNTTDTITLPFDNLPGNKTYQLQRNNNQTSIDLKDCTTLSGREGQCRHLAQCSLSSFKHDIQEYKEYFCQIDNFAGACCPKSLFPQVVTSQEPSSETSTTTSV